MSAFALVIIGCPTFKARTTTTGEVGVATTGKVDAEGEVDVESETDAEGATSETNIEGATGETSAEDGLGWGWFGVNGDTESTEESELTTEGSKGEHDKSLQRPQACNGEEQARTEEIVGVTIEHEGSSKKDVKLKIVAGVPDIASESEKHYTSNLACRVI